jgi:hypothetical protein
VKELYRGESARALAALGDLYQPPAEFKHGQDTLVAKLPAETDGREVHIYELRMPARFYRIHVPASNDWAGKPQPAFTLGTGSGQDQLVVDIAKAIATGMLDMEMDSPSSGDAPARPEKGAP